MSSETVSRLRPPAESPVTRQDRFLAFIARFCLVLLFPFSALDKIFDYHSAAAQAAGAATPLGAQATALYSLVEAAGAGARDFSGIIQLLRGNPQA